MRASERIKNKIKSYESCQLLPYKDAVGYYTVGYGHKCTDMTYPHRITQERAEELFEKDIRATESGLNSLNLPRLTQNQYDALVSFTFNLGIARLRRSTLLKRIYARSPAKYIQDEFRKWVYAGKTVLQGLVKRREYEAQLWVQP